MPSKCSLLCLGAAGEQLDEVVKQSNILPDMMLGGMLGEMLDRLTGALRGQFFAKAAERGCSMLFDRS